MEKQIIKNRLAAIRTQLAKKKANAFVIIESANVTYTTGFSGSDSRALITPKNIYLITDSRYTQQARKQCRFCRIIERTDSMAKAINTLVKKQKSIKTLAVEDCAAVAELKKLRKNINGKLKILSNIIEPLRTVKETYEISAIKTAAKIAAQAFEQIKKVIKPGITENELAGLLELQIRKAGGINSFDTIAAFGANASVPHHQPTGRKLRQNDTVLVDFGARYKGYCCDITRCIAVGRPSEFYKKVEHAVRRAQAAAIKMIKPGVEFKKVDAAAREVICAAGLPVYGHGTGHGLGLEVHEQPVISQKSKGRFEPAMVLTIEPAVYIPGRLGIRIEDDILVTETGCKILTVI